MYLQILGHQISGKLVASCSIATAFVQYIFCIPCGSHGGSGVPRSPCSCDQAAAGADAEAAEPSLSAERGQASKE